jgi:hypothetical protein
MPLQDRQVTMCKYDGGKGTTNVSAQLNIGFGGGRQLPSTKHTENELPCFNTTNSCLVKGIERITFY